MATDPWDAISAPVSRYANPPAADPWAGISAPTPAQQPSGGSIRLPAGISPHDGDTLPLGNGQNGRLYGVDAFEIGQHGYMPSGPTDLGGQGQMALSTLLARGGVASPTGTSTYGRPVVTLDAGGDAGKAMVSQGMALPEPRYLSTDAQRQHDYIEAQRAAIAAEKGAYSGQYQLPSDYRHMGDAAPMHGKIGMSPEQSAAYSQIVRDPKSTPADLEAWAQSQGQAIMNAGNILSFVRRNPSAKLPGYFQQQDVTGSPVLRDGPGAVTRTMGSLNEGIADTLGAPVDLVSAGMRVVGLPIGEKPWGGSANISSLLHDVGVGQTDDSFAPRSDIERYAQSIARGVGQAAIPLGGTLGIGGKLATAGRMFGGGNAVSRALSSTAIEAAMRPGLAVAGEVGGAIGGGIGGQGARDAFPGNPIADMAGQIIGGGIGGFAGSFVARRPLPPHQRVVEAAEAGQDSAGAQSRDQVRSATVPGNVVEPRTGMSAPAVSRDGQQFVGWATDQSTGQPYPTYGPVSPHTSPMASDLPPGPSITGPSGDWDTISSPTAPATGPHGPIHADLAGDYYAGIRKLATDQTGEIPGALQHPEIGPIDLVWGQPGTGDRDGYGLSKIIRRHPEVLDDLPEILSNLPVRARPEETGNNRWVLENDAHRAVIAPDFDGDPKRWLVTAFEKKAPGGSDISPRSSGPDGGSTSAGAGIDIGASPHAGNGWDAISSSLEASRPIRMDERIPPEQMAGMARTVQPDDLVPKPSNEIGSVDEAAAINAGQNPELVPPNPRDMLSSYTLPGSTRSRRNPLDLAAWLRTQGGIQEQGGELAYRGIDNKPRDIPLAGDVGLPRLVTPDGMPHDEAARAAWEAGYFPNHTDRPPVTDFLDSLGATHRGDSGRLFHPDDWDAISNYHGADADRQMIEGAAARGEPLHVDRSQPVDMNDLDANSAPASAYEDLPKVWGRVGNIDVAKLNTSEDIGRAINAVNAKVGGFDAASRGRIAHAETRALAQGMGMTADDLLRRRKGQALNAEQAVAARSILAKSSDELVKLARKANGGSDADLAALRQAWVRHAAIQEQVSGATAEAGRALSSFRMSAASGDVAGRIHKLILEESGGRDRLEEVAKSIVDLADSTNDPAKVSKFARDALKLKMADKLGELYINSLLSGPQTHAANFLSNSLTAALQIPEHVVASALGALRPGSADRVLAGELPARMFGMLQGAREGLRAAGDTMMTGRVPDHVSKVEAAEQHAISGVKGSIIRTPTRALSAADELFKGVARRMEINGLALRKARGEGLKGDDLRNRVAALSANPSEEMFEQAKDYARYVTFQRPLGKFGQSISSISNFKAGPIPLGKLIIPFVRTPANLMKFAIERSPAAPLLKEWREDMQAGGARRDLAASKAMMGSGLGMLIMQYAADGKISGGGPTDDRAAAMMRADGWQPYSVKIGNHWVSYSRFDPLALTIGTAADLATKSDKMTESQREEAAGVVTASIVRSLADKTWLSGVSQLVNLLDDPMRYGGTYMRNEAASIAVPALLAQIARASDPYQRDTKTVMDTMKARVPGLYSNVPARLDVWGAPTPRSNLSYGLNAIAPVNVSSIRADPVNQALLAAGARISKPSSVISGVQLTPDQQRAYQIEVGRRGYAAMSGLTQSYDWAAMSNAERQDAVETLMRTSRSDARNALGFSWKKAPKRMFGRGLASNSQ